MSFLIANAYADNGAPAAGGDPITMFLFFGGMIAIFYFLLIRPQQKRAKEHRQMVAALGKNDEIITNGGMLGKIAEVGEQYITLEIAQGVQVRVQRSAIATVLPKGSIKAAEKE
jgi:preprotein translocase subunit YajC